MTARPAALVLLLLASVRGQDLVPTKIEATIAPPFSNALPDYMSSLPATALHDLTGTGVTRCMAGLGDLDGDGASDLALGRSPGDQPSLLVRSGGTGEILWSAVPGGQGGFRSLRGLLALDGQLVVGLSSLGGRVERRDAATGDLLWSRPLGRADRLAHVYAVDAIGPGDVLACGGTGVEAVVRLAGGDGKLLWRSRFADTVYDVRPASDLDGDGSQDVLAAGGDGAPFVAALSGADGRVLWKSPLDGPGAVVHPTTDIDGDGIADLVVGQFAAPLDGLRGFDGAHGQPLWTLTYTPFDVTSLAPFADADGDGDIDLAVGSFDNAVSALSPHGFLLWRRELGIINGGHAFAVAAAGDLDGFFGPDVFAASVNGQAYALEGRRGFPFAALDLRVRGLAVAALDDVDGDGRSDLAVGAQDKLLIASGAQQLALGPVVQITPPESLEDEVLLAIWAMPQLPFALLGSLGTGTLGLAGFDQPLGLDLATLTLIHLGIAPGSLQSGIALGPFDHSLVGQQVFLQAATLYQGKQGLLSDVASFPIVP